METGLCSPGSALPGGSMSGPQQAAQSGRPEPSSAYWIRRRRNNEAARRCRERRRMEEVLLELKAMELMKENQRLRAALCALYPGHRSLDWQIASTACPAQTLPLNHGDSRLSYRAWGAQTLRPVCQPAAPASLPQPCQHGTQQGSHPSDQQPPSLHPASPAHNPQPGTLGPSSLTSLPHKLRIKGARALSWAGRGLGGASSATEIGGH
ncbi:transcription factor atf-2-like [Pelobates fuscus]|uniref:transcription factor atf-2-like n=1 Tax=Pelobates fuscus TaxID=191477 RepID=UPI002FE4B156